MESIPDHFDQAVLRTAGQTTASQVRHPQIVIQQHGHMIDIPVALRAALADHLGTRRYVVGGVVGKAIVTSQIESLIVPSPPRPNAGIAWVVLYVLLQHGYQHIQLASTPKNHLPPPNLKQGTCVVPINPELMNGVQTQQTGLIEFEPGVDPGLLMVQLIQAWPQATFSIATASHAEAKRLRQQFFQLQIKSSLATPRFWPDHPKRVVIGTYTALADPEVQKRQIFIAANAVHALSEAGQCCLLHPDARYRLLGFLPAKTALSNWEKDWLMATFGLEKITIPAHGWRDVRPAVVWQPVRWHHADEHQPSNHTPSSMVVNLHVRNRQIVRLAKSLLRKDQARLRNGFPQVGSELHQQPVQVIVLTDGLPHALVLAKVLPSWPIYTGEIGASSHLSSQHRQLLESRKGGWNLGVGGMITTATAAPRLTLPNNGVVAVLWASGGTYLPPLPPAWLMAPSGSTRELLVVDFADRGQSKLVGDTRRRKSQYDRAEWLPPGSSVLLHRIKRFLRSR